MWNEENFDINVIPYTAEAYRVNKFAFVSDYARFRILYEHGGVYFDTDVKVVKSMADILDNGAYMGMERDYDVDFTVNSGLGLAAPPGLAVYKAILDKYSELHFINKDGTLNLATTVRIVTSVLLASGVRPAPGIINACGLRIYPPEYFNPLNSETRRLTLTANTRTIHQYAGSWHTPWEEFVFWTRRHFGEKMSQAVSLLGHNPYYIIKRILRFCRSGK